MEFDIKKYARLANILLSEEEAAQYEKDISGLLAHVEELKRVDVKGVEPVTGGTELKNVFRPDGDGGKLAREFEPDFPETKDGYLKVPKIIDNG